MCFICHSVPLFAKVRCWPSCEVNRQILIWFHCDGEDPQWTVPEQQEITKGEWVYRGRTEHFISAHIEVGTYVCGLFEDENQFVRCFTLSGEILINNIKKHSPSL